MSHHEPVDVSSLNDRDTAFTFVLDRDESSSVIRVDLSVNQGTSDAVIATDASVSERAPLLAKSNRTVQADKDIGFFESLVYMFVQNYGFAILSVPIVFQQAGMITTTVSLFYFSVVATFAASLLAEAMTMIPGNSNFEKNLEYVNVVEHFFGRKVYYFFQFVLNTSLSCTTIASIRVTCQAVDSLIILIFGKTFGLVLYPHPEFQAATSTQAFYSNQITLSISLGYLVITALLIPLGMIQLKGNIKVQALSILVVVFCLCGFIWHFSTRGLDFTAVPLVNSELQQVLGVFIFSLGFASMVPSWVNQKQSQVSPRVVIWSTSMVAMLLNFIVPLLGAFAYPNLKTDDLLQEIGYDPAVITKVAVYLYTLSVITTSIPVYCITIKNNLYTGGVCGSKLATFLGAIFPWIVGWIFNSGSVFAAMLNWASLFLTCFIAFFFPFACYLKGQSLFVSKHGKPSSVLGIIPAPILRFWKPFVGFLFASIALPTVLQIILDLYFAIVLGKDLVG